MDTIQAFGVVANIFETSQAAIQMSKDGESDYQRWILACQIASLELGFDLSPEYENASWRAFVNLTMIGQ